MRVINLSESDSSLEWYKKIVNPTAPAYPQCGQTVRVMIL